jgi:hypothetical protein
MNGWRAYVYQPSGAKAYPASNGGLANGANHVGKCGVNGDTMPCEASLTVKGHWLFTATQTGNHLKLPRADLRDYGQAKAVSTAPHRA